MRSFWRVGTLAVLGVLAIVGVLAACGGSAATAHTAGPAGRASTSGGSASPRTPAASAAATRTPPGGAQAAAGSGTPPASPRAQVTLTRMRTPDGSVVTLATFQGPVRYVLHNGSQDPGLAAARLVRAGPDVAGAERRQLLAAFNGGFELSADVGGYEQEGRAGLCRCPDRDGA